MAHLCAVPGASAGVWLRQIAWNHMSGVSVRLSPGFLISPCGLSTWLAVGSRGSIRDCSKSKSPQMQKHLSNLCSHHNSHCPIGESKSHRWGTTRWVNAKCGSVAAAKANVHYPCIHIWKNTWSPNQRSSHCMNPHPCTPLVNPKIFFLSFKGKMITSMIWTEIFPMLLNLIMKQGSLKLWQSWSGWKRRRLSSLQTSTVAPWWPVTHSITAFQVSKHSPRSGF